MIAISLMSAQRALKKMASPARARTAASFFKTGKGEYAEGDRFLGISMPELRKLAVRFASLSVAETQKLLRSPYNEQRLLALLIWVRAYALGDEKVRAQIYRAYLAQTKWINNWNLVDASAREIVGEHLLERSRAPLDKLLRSPSLWERRIAIVATFRFIRAGECAETFRLAPKLFEDPEDLMHKATGWMLRETGRRDRAGLCDFLQKHAAEMPRTMLRYAIEHFSPEQRRIYMERR